MQCLTTLEWAGSILTYSDIPSPHWRQRRKSHSDAVEITIKKQAYLASIRPRGTIMAANRKTRHNNSVTQKQYGRRAVFVLGDVRFQDGDAIDVGKLGGAVSRLFLLSFNDLLALAYFAIRYIHRTTAMLWYNCLCGIRVLFVHDASQCAWRIIPTMSDSLHWYLYQIYQACSVRAY